MMMCPEINQATRVGLLAMLVAAPPLTAQGVVQGVVRQSNGRGMPGVTVEVVGNPPSVLTNDTGGYVIPNVPAGTGYTVRGKSVTGETDSARFVAVMNGGTTVVNLWSGQRPADWAVVTDSIPLGAAALSGPVLLYLDTLAVTPASGSPASRSDTRDSLAVRGFTFVTDSGGVMVFGIPRNLLGDTLAYRDSAFRRAARLRSDLSTFVRQAGPFVRLDPTGSPVVATNEVVIELPAAMSDAAVQSLVATVRGVWLFRVRVGAGRHVVRALDHDGPALASRLMTQTGGSVTRAHVAFHGRAGPSASPGTVPGPGDQWHLGINVAGAESRIQANGGPQGSPIVAVIDGDGIATNHSLLSATSGWNFRDGTASTVSAAWDGAHGTAMAGLAVANDALGSGVAMRGICPGCRVMPIVHGSTSLDQMAYALEYAITKSADVIAWAWIPMLSVQEIQLLVPDLYDAVTLAAVSIPVVLSAGNGAGDNPCSEGAQQLQSLPGIIVVGASNHRDYGIPAAEGSCITLLAPGGTGGFLGLFPPTGSGAMQGLVTTDVPGPGGLNPGSCSSDYSYDQYTRCFGGTSAAAPLVAGVVGLMLQADPGLNAAGAKTILESSTDKIDKLRAGYDNVTGHSPTHGYGRVNACTAVAMTAGDSGAGCAVDLRPRWFKWLAVLAVVLVVPAFIVAGVFCGWCHWLTIVLAALAAFVLAFAAASYLDPKIRRWRMWIAIGVAIVVLAIWLIVCL